MNIPKQYRTREEYDLPAVPGGPTRLYVICSTARSGSTLLGRLLEGTGEMGVPYEYFNVPVHARPLAARLGVPLNRPGKYLEAVAAVRTTANGVFGLKGHHHQLGPLLAHPALVRVMESATLVWIRRRDLLGQAISLYKAGRSKVWSVTAGDAPPPKVDYSHDGIRAAMRTIIAENAAWEEHFASQGLEVLPVWYERLLEDPQGVCQEVCRRVLGRDSTHTFSLDQSDIVKMRDNTTDEWRDRFIAASRAGLRQDFARRKPAQRGERVAAPDAPRQP